MDGWRIVTHTPVWARTDLPFNNAGATWPGYTCVYELENGAGQCGGTVLDPADDSGEHACGWWPDTTPPVTS